MLPSSYFKLPFADKVPRCIPFCVFFFSDRTPAEMVLLPSEQMILPSGMPLISLISESSVTLSESVMIGFTISGRMMKRLLFVTGSSRTV